MIFFKIISFIVLTVNIMKLPKLYKKKYSNICHILKTSSPLHYNTN